MDDKLEFDQRKAGVERKDRRWALVLSIFAILISLGSLGVTMQNVRIQARAFLAVSPGYVYNFRDSSKPEFHFVVRNVGPTFALNTQVFAVAKLSSELSNAELDSLGDGERLPSLFTATPQANYPFRVNSDALPVGGQAEVIASRQRLYVFGRVRYSDTFGTPHYTEFCFVYSGEHDPGLTGFGFRDFQAVYCNGHNRSS